MAVSRAAVVPGPRGVNRVAYERAAPRVWEVPAPPLPMRDVPAVAPAPRTFHQRTVYVITPTPQVSRPVVRRNGPARVTPAQLRRARSLKRLGQRDLAAKLNCARSTIAEAEHDRRPILPNMEEWVEQVLREHGEWEAPEETES